MQRFDCLAQNCPLFGPHLLEASAGTGKTFSIEHIYVRLLLESKEDPIEAEQILAVTFTRAATRELKARIRANLEKALFLLRSKSEESSWGYLKPYFRSDSESGYAQRVLADALAAFDRCQIFTIHRFCHRMLKEFAFEARGGFSLPDPDGEKKVPEQLKRAVRDFLECGLTEKLLCPEQLALLLKKYGSIEEIGDLLLRSAPVEPMLSFLERFRRFQAALKSWHGDRIVEEKLKEDFAALEKGYKAKVKGNFSRQIAALANCFSELEDPSSFRILMREKGTLFQFLDPANRKIKAVSPSFLHYPGFFEWGSLHLSSFFDETSKKVMRTLRAAWQPIAQKILSEEEWSHPDDLLLQMKKAVENREFRSCIQKKYRAAIIDEFQDTDAVQWEIFQTLFLEGSFRAVYLVGDPKQSIYRFRKADVYTYLKARDFLGEAQLYHLDTNFRSSKPLIGTLNALFSRDWLHLPQAQRTLPYHPVKAGTDLDSNFLDGKGALHFLLAEGDPNDLFDAAYLPYAAQEIERMRPEVKNWNAFALLVKDRHQSEKALRFLRERNIPAVARSQTALGETLGFQAIQELFDALAPPHDLNAVQIVLQGPFFSFSFKKELASPEFPFIEWKERLEREGLVSFWRSFLNEPVHGSSVKEQIVSTDLSLYLDVMQIIEILLEWERKEGFSFEGLNRFLRHLRYLGPEEGGRRRMEADEAAVQIMTLHVSKGLEFDLVFALGLAKRTPDTEETEQETEELNAEKLRQLYVAMTRAKRRLYVPIALSPKEEDPATSSPMELFCRHLEKESSLPDYLQGLCKRESATCETLSLPFRLQSSKIRAELRSIPEPIRLMDPVSPPPSYLSSFTSLAPKKGEGDIEWVESPGNWTLHTLPRGTETGIVVHRLFERVFSLREANWKEPEIFRPVVEEELRFSPLSPWKDALLQMISQTLLLELEAEGEKFSLSELDPSEWQVEWEFLFSDPPHFVKGFIDLLFSFRGKTYFLDWKTNWLGPDESAYHPEALHLAMKGHHYDLQAALYAEALRRYWTVGSSGPFFEKTFGGAFYLFLRGNAALHLRPDLTLIRECHAKKYLL